MNQITLTNIALSIQQDPSIKNNIKEIVLMGGAAMCLGNITPAAEFNIYDDPHAANVVLNSGIEGGAFLKRAHMPNEDKGGRTFLKEDLKVGGEVTIFGRKFHIYDCDGFTRDCVNEINQR